MTKKVHNLFIKFRSFFIRQYRRQIILQKIKLNYLSSRYVGMYCIIPTLAN